MKVKATVHGTETMKSIRKDYPKLGSQQAVAQLLCDAFKFAFKKEKEINYDK